MPQINPHQHEVLTSLDDVIRNLTRVHKSRKGVLWMPSELVREDHMPPDLPPGIIAMLVLNMITEDGLPYFFGLLTHHLGPEKAIGEWTRVWTAEENRHGAALQYYMKLLLPNHQMVGVERLEHQYMEKGFWPNWEGEPYQLLAYVVIQEMATQISHSNIARQAKENDHTLMSLLGKIAGEEGAHHTFYLNLFRHILRTDSTGAVLAFQKALRKFSMPGQGVEGFGDLAYLQEKKGVFGASEFALIVDKVTERLELESLGDLTPADEEARDAICKYSGTLRKVAMRKKRKGEVRTIPLPFLGRHVSITI